MHGEVQNLVFTEGETELWVVEGLLKLTQPNENAPFLLKRLH